MTLQIELFLLAVSVLFFLSILAGKAGSRLGVPALLLFLGVGMLSGSDGLGIQFENIQLAQAIGTVALCIILFSGGLDTKILDIKPIMLKGVLLATVGVLLTAIITGLLIWYVLGQTMQSASIGFITSLLMASTMSSTDSASVFSLLRSKGLRLDNNLKPMLELESGSNDPMAYVLVITLIQLALPQSEVNFGMAILILLSQLAIGFLAGYLGGKLAVFSMNKLNIDNPSLYPILVFTFCIFIFSATYFLKGNGYLAVYIGGLVVGNSKFINKRTSLKFFDGLAWISQLLMFLTLGLLVNPHELIPIIIPGLIISLLMIFIARPLSVFLCLLPFRKMPAKDKTFISWVGLRGAVPIVFAIMPLAQDVPHARLIFNIVFFCTLVSLILQGTTISTMARWLGVSDETVRPSRQTEFDMEFSEEIKSVTCEITIKQNHLKKGNRLMDLEFPEKTLAVMVKRDNLFFVPKGNTVLHLNDKLLIITDDNEALAETYKKLEIEADT